MQKLWSNSSLIHLDIINVKDMAIVRTEVMDMYYARYVGKETLTNLQWTILMGKLWQISCCKYNNMLGAGSKKKK